MKIIADENMSAVQEVFAPYGKVETLAGRDIDAASVATADVLLVRSVTRVDEQLLEGSRVRFVGSATIGTDHIDLHYLRQKSIDFAHAPGCNAEAVVQYMFSVFCTLEPQWRDKKVGIVGCGNVGGRLFRRLSALGVECQVYDPLLSATDLNGADLSPIECGALSDLQTVLGADIICLHTPLTRDGRFPTQHLINQQALEEYIRPGALLINAGRGGVIDNAALLAHLRNGADLNVALDVWEGEPDINVDLLQQINLATPHIAGYSLEGRLRGTLMVRDGMCRCLGLALEDGLCSSAVGLTVGEEGRAGDCLSLEVGQGLDEAILGSYPVAADDRQMRKVLGGLGAKSGDRTGVLFDGLRKHYAQRCEFSYYSVSGPGARACRSDLDLLGFKPV
ncbi:MAG: 4-phosphoerythronate dehydrogenase [Gammaproteobacteria bacterium]|nr:4-phosphoerythronate dehydrogenase [Gammaproteobacteria bacterium]MBQ0840452.1 4-phosphoerythronate dehydrogenase [Gammaproteobacteria bacterium]